MTTQLNQQVRDVTEQTQALIRQMSWQLWINAAFMGLGSFMGTIVGTFLYLWFTRR